LGIPTFLEQDQRALAGRPYGPPNHTLNRISLTFLVHFFTFLAYEAIEFSPVWSQYKQALIGNDPWQSKFMRLLNLTSQFQSLIDVFLVQLFRSLREQVFQAKFGAHLGYTALGT
jgi:hypothetical protein